MYYIETGSLDPCWNLAFEEYLLTHRTEGSWLMLWQNDNTIVIGLNQNTSEEINAAFVSEHRINVVRRTTGGGAVYHDLGNLNYSFIADAGAPDEMSIGAFSRPVCEALKELGLNAEVGGRNDITIDGKKVSGIAQRVYKNRLLHHGTLLFRSNPEMIAGALNVDPAKFQSKSAKSVRSRVGNISDFLPEDMTMDEFRRVLTDRLCRDGAVPCSLGEQELEEIKALADSKYRSYEWTYGRSPAFSFRNRVRHPGGTLEVRLDAEKGMIKSIAFSGDFMAVTDSDTAVEALTGVPLLRGSILNALENVDIASVFGGITAQEISDTILGAI